MTTPQTAAGNEAFEHTAAEQRKLCETEIAQLEDGRAQLASALGRLEDVAAKYNALTFDLGLGSHESAVRIESQRQQFGKANQNLQELIEEAQRGCNGKIHALEHELANSARKQAVPQPEEGKGNGSDL